MSMTASVRGRRRPRTLAAPLACLACVVALAPAAGAAPNVERQVAGTASSASWGAVAVPAGAAAGTGPLAINWQTIGGGQRVFLDIVSVGTLDLVGMTVDVSTVRNTGGGNAAFPMITLEACVGAAWNASANSCSGSVQVLGATTGGSLPVTSALGSGQRLSMRASSSGNPGVGSRFTTSLSVAVSRGQARAPMTVSS